MATDKDLTDKSPSELWTIIEDLQDDIKRLKVACHASNVPCTGMKNINSIVPIGILARKLKVKSSWLRAEAEAGRLPHVKAGDTILFDPITIERVLLERARRKGAADEPR